LIPALVLAVAHAPCFPAPSEEVRLAATVREGERTSVRAELVLTLSARDPGAEAKGAEKPDSRPAAEGEEGAGEKESPKAGSGAWSLRVAHSEQREETVAHAAEGRATESRREVRRSSVRRRTREGKEEPKEQAEDSPLHERTLVLKREGSEARVVSGSERLKPDLLALLEMDLPLAALLPKERVERGASWTVEGSPFEKWARYALWGVCESVSFGGELKCTYRGTAEVEGESLDELEVEGKLPISLLAPALPPKRRFVAGTADFRGTAHFDRAAGRFVRFEGRGEVRPREAASPDPEAAAVPAEGEISLLLEVREAAEPGLGETLALRYKEGDLFTCRERMKLDLSVENLQGRIVAGGHSIDLPEQEVEMHATADYETVEEVLKAEGGRPTSVRIEFTRAREKTEVKGPFEKGEEEPEGDVEGVVAVVTRDGEDVAVKVESGTLPEAWKRALTPDDPVEKLLPREPVTKGSAWTVEGEELAAFLLLSFLPHAEEAEVRAKVKKILQGIDGGIEARLAEFVEKDGLRCARIPLHARLALDPDVRELVPLLAGEGEEAPEAADLPDVEIRITVELQGELLFAVKEGRPVSFEFQAPIKVRLHVSHSGEMELDVRAEIGGTVEASAERARGRSGK
jgi:hypothetical protein